LRPARLIWKTRLFAETNIGSQAIMPKTGTSQKPAPQQQASECQASTPPVARQASPPPGMGKFVDKTA
jgi:hypothetical protein